MGTPRELETPPILVALASERATTAVISARLKLLGMLKMLAGLEDLMAPCAWHDERKCRRGRSGGQLAPLKRPLRRREIELILLHETIHHVLAWTIREFCDYLSHDGLDNIAPDMGS